MNPYDMNKKSVISKLDFLIFITFPVYPLIDYMIAHDFVLYKAIVENIYPYTTIVASLLFILFSSHKLKFYPLQIAFAGCFLLSIVINAFWKGWIWEYGPAIITILFCTIFISIFLQKNRRESYLYFKYFGYCYTFLVIVIFVYRYIFYGMSMGRLRAAGLYAAHGPAIWLLFMIFLAMENEKKKDAVIWYLLLVLDGIVFASRGVVIASIMILLFICIKNRMKNLFPIITLSLIMFGILYCFGGYELLQSRMDSRNKNAFRYDNLFLGSRYPIIIEGLELLTNDYVSELFGYGLGKYRYLTERSVGHSKISTPHNMLLDIWGTGGGAGLFLLIYLMFKSVYFVNNRLLYIIITVYALFGGISLIFISGTMTWGFNYLVYLYIFYDSKRRNAMRILHN